MRPQELCETVRVKMEPSDANPSGVVVINKCDFIEGEHQLADAVEEVEAPEEPKPEVSEVPNNPWAPKT